MRIDAALLIPGRGQPIADGTVMIEGSTLTYAGPRSGAPPSDHVVHVPAVMPGLWDCHGHYSGMVDPNLEKDVSVHAATKAARTTADLAATLDAGVTSVREVGGLGVYLRPVLDEGVIRGPRLYPAGHILSTTGGHVDVHGLPLDWLMAPHSSPMGVLCDGVPECLKAVRTQLRNGAEVIKLCASGGVMSEIDHPIHQQFSDEELRAIVEEAARAERAVAAHCHGKPGILAAVRAGVTTIEHGSYLDDESAQAMLDAGTILVPTRFIVEAGLEMEDRLPPYAYRKMVAIAHHHEQALKTAIAAGVPIAMGTDIFISGDMHGANSREIRHLIDAGMTTLEAIEAATANGPRTLGLRAPRSGLLKTDYDADVIAFDTDPIVDNSVWGDPSRVTHIWKAGELVKGSGLSPRNEAG